MTEAQIQLQNALTTTFLANLAFLSEYDNELYHRVDELSRMIENGTYKEKYALEFIMESGDFDIYDIVNDKYMYNRNPKKKNDELIRKVDFDDKNSIFNIEDYFLYKSDFEINLENRFDFGRAEDLEQKTMNEVAKYSEITKDYLKNKKKRLKKIEKFIFLGTLLGRHIPKIVEKVDAKIYLVLERNLETFRLSLFTVDYTILAKDGVVFSIMDDEINEKKKIEKFINNISLENYLLKFSTTNINIEDYVVNIVSLLSAYKPTMYDYNRILYNHINRTTKRLNEGSRFLDFKKIKEELNILQNKPVLYLAAGPSFGENIDWIRENQDKFIIVCIGKVVKKLIENEIRIDIITTLDEDHLMEEWQFKDEIVSKISKNTLLLASSITSEKVLNKFNRNNIYLFEVFNPIFKGNIVFDGYSVGEMSLELVIKLNFKEIYILGLDLTVNQETGETHSNVGDSVLRKINIDKKDDLSQFGIKTSVVKIKGNFIDELKTSGLLYLSVYYLNHYCLNNISEDINIYNLSEIGAYFVSTKPTKITDLKMKDFKSIDFKNTNLNKILDDYCKNELNQDEKKTYKEETEGLKILIQDIKEYLSEDIDSFEEFRNIVKTIYSKQIAISIDSNLLAIVLQRYYFLVFPYLSYHFNDKKIKYEKKKINKIKIVFQKQIIGFIEDYIYCIERLLNNK